MANKVFSYEIKQVGDEKDRTLRFVGSCEVEDRDGDVILTEGIMTQEYMSNPVFMVQHDYKNLPCGKTLQIIPDMVNRKTTFVVKFPTIEELSSNPKTPSDHALLCDTVYKMYKSGYLNAVSIGFSGVEWEPRMATNGGQGRLYKKINLYEISAVCVPSNPSALISARAAGILNTKTAKFFTRDDEINLDDIDPKELKRLIVEAVREEVQKLSGIAPSVKAQWPQVINLDEIEYTPPEIDLDAIECPMEIKYPDIAAALERSYIPNKEARAAYNRWKDWKPEDPRYVLEIDHGGGIKTRLNAQESAKLVGQLMVEDLKKVRGY